MKKLLIGLVFSLGWSLWFTSPLQAQAEPFFKGKTVRIVVGFSPGGTFDLWGRVIAQHMGKYVAGNPAFVVQNMPGAGSMTAANYVYGVAKPDGLTLGLVSPSLYIEQLAGRKEVQFDWGKFSWIGSPETTGRIFYVRADTPYKTIEDIRKAVEPAKCGATGLGTVSHYFPRLLEEALGLKLNIVLGYPGSSEVNLAIERGEAHCWGGTVQAFFGSEPGRTWAKNGFVKVLLQGGQKRDPRLPEVPTIWELMDTYRTSDGVRRLAKVLLAPDDLGRPFMAGPGIPADRLRVLREAFMKTMHDAELLAEARKKALEASPSAGDHLEGLAKELLAQPAEVVERMKTLLAK